VLHIALRATALRAALDPGDPCGPWEQEERAGHSLPPPGAGATRPARPWPWSPQPQSPRF